MIYAEIEKNAGEIIKIQSTEFKGRTFVDCRVWTKLGGQPTRKGLTISPKIVPQLVEGLRKAIQDE